MSQTEPERDGENLPPEGAPDAAMPVVNDGPIAEPPPRPQSPARRWLRSVVRWLLLLVLLFSTGLLTAFYLLYQPAQQRGARLEGELNSVRGELATAQADLKGVREQSRVLQAELDEASGALESAQNRATLQMVLTNVANARLALANKDATNARAALAKAQTDLEKLLPAIAEQDKDLADSLMARLTLASKELGSDARTAIADLDVLTRNLQEVEKTLFQE